MAMIHKFNENDLSKEVVKILNTESKAYFIHIEGTNNYKCTLYGQNGCKTIYKDYVHSANAKKHLKQIHEKAFNNIIFDAELKCKRKNETIFAHLKNKFQQKENINVKISKNEFVDILIDMFSCRGRPFLMINDLGFRKLVEPYCKAFEITLTRKTIRDMIHEKRCILEAQISQKIKNTPISIQFDASTRHRRHFISVIIQYFKENQINLFHLGTFELLKQATSENLKTNLFELIKKFEISPLQITSCCVDNGRNMVKAIFEMNKDLKDMFEGDDSEKIYSYNSESDQNSENRIFFEDYLDDQYDLETEIRQMIAQVPHKIETIRCMAHTFQLGINLFLKKYKKDLVEIRQIILKLRTPKFSQELKNQGYSVPIRDNDTRWFSQYLMIQSFLKLKKYVLLKQQEELDFKLDKKQWDFIEELVDVLSPAYRFNLQFQKDGFLLSEFKFYYIKLINNLEKKSSRMGKKLILDLSEKCLGFLNSSLVCACTLLDVRFKRILNSDEIKKGIDFIQNFETNNQSLFRNEDNLEVQTTKSEEIFVDENSDEKFLQEYCPNFMYENTQKTLIDQIAEIEFYPNISPSESIFEFWRMRKNSKKLLYSIATTILSFPATQVSVERSFSDLNFVFQPKRANLSSDILNDILFIRLNTKFLDQ